MNTKMDSGPKSVGRMAGEWAGHSRPRLLYVVSEDWYFLLHRLPMACAARDAGFDVHVATRVQKGGEDIRREGFVLHPIPFARGRVSPLAMLRTIAAIRRILRELQPSIIHSVSLQPCILSSLAAIGVPAARVNALTGLGFIFSSTSAKARLLRPLVSRLMRAVMARGRSVTLVENRDDRDALETMGLNPGRIILIGGSGVDTERLQPMAEPDGPFTVAFAGRLLEDKGIRTLVETHRMLRGRGLNIELLVAGTPDPANPATISEEEAESWNKEPGITWLGHVEDISFLWKRAHIAALPSYREGLPISLLEAAASGRPMVATDVPGCREICLHETTGLLVPVNDPGKLADAIARLMASKELRERYGQAARRLAVERFSAQSIGQQTVALYRALIEAG